MGEEEPSPATTVRAATSTLGGGAVAPAPTHFTERHQRGVDWLAPSAVPALGETSAEVADVLSQCPRSATGSDGTWMVVVDVDDAMGERVAESVLTVADGLMGTRGSLEEDGPRAEAATYASGLYEPNKDTGQALVPLPSWATLELTTSPGPGRRVLDMRSGVLWRIVPG